MYISNFNFFFCIFCFKTLVASAKNIKVSIGGSSNHDVSELLLAREQSHDKFK